VDTPPSPTDDLRALFPGLKPGVDYNITSPATDVYNCVGGVIRDMDWWEPEPYAQWQNDLEGNGDLAEYIEFFGRHGFTDCQTPALQPTIEKIAIYAKDDVFTHVAYQRVDGKWWSKLGPKNDVWHLRSDTFNGHKQVGEVIRLMARTRQPHDVANSDGLLLPPGLRDA
jgi:hypothetical protein